MADPLRGEIWTVDFDPVRGHEQAGRRPALILSTNLFNRSPADLVIVIPITSQDKHVRSHVLIDPPDGGVKRRSFIKCEDVRSVSKQRLSKRWGSVSQAALHAVEDNVRVLLQL
ncbi:MAG: type II toxin-antitoxin system PemK/MazF family toxin [Planctomycetes bacterium]|nr:type II toxin-antitoxin system PemK/MazF family toxin [Planctomycetota bacterium]